MGVTLANVRLCRHLLALWVGLRGLSVWCAQPPVSLGELSAAEKYLVTQAAQGELAQFTNSTSHEIRGRLVEELLTGTRAGFSMHRNGLQVEGAVVREMLDLRNSKIAHDIRFTRCSFEAGANFSKSAFENSVSLERCEFKGPGVFYAMKVGRGLFLQNAEFRKGADFSQVDVTGVLLAGGAKFLATNESAEFVGLNVTGNAFFTNATFAGPVNFQYSHFSESLRWDAARCLNPRALISFEAVKVAGTASFIGAQFDGYVSLKDATLASLELADVQWPTQKREEWLWLNGLSYQRIAAGSGMNSWSNLLWLVNRAAHRTAYSTDVYTSLCDFYRREGYPRQANKFFIAQKRREREEVLHGAPWAWNFFLDWFVGYGRSPERALFWSAAIVLWGVKVFRPEVMEPRRADAKPDVYSPFWYSTDLFLPLVKLQDSDLWKPRDTARFPRFWSRIHTMLGWALIPIAVAAWTGMLEQ